MPGWVYRVDPNGKWHYYTENSGAGRWRGEARRFLVARRKGYQWVEADMNASLAQDDKQHNDVEDVKVQKYSIRLEPSKSQILQEFAFKT